MQVFVVTSGEYSDYGINAIFSTKEKAQEYIDRMEFCSSYEEYYNIHEWNVDEVSKEIPTNDLCLYNGEVVKLDDLNTQFAYEGYCAFCYFNCYIENSKSRVLEITKEDYLKYLSDNNWENEIDINIVQFPIYCVRDVKYNKDKSIMYKTVYDEIAKYKAEKEGL